MVRGLVGLITFTGIQITQVVKVRVVSKIQNTTKALRLIKVCDLH